jgi:hypothetical protein
MPVIFIFSTGRCGTQWLAKSFADNLGTSAEVTHEPLGAYWAPRQALRHPDLAALRRQLPKVDRHIDRIGEIVAAGRIYVETGFPSYAWMPYLKSMWGDQFRWAHVVRHPMFTAGSLVTHACYETSSHLYVPEYGEHVYLQPTDAGVVMGDLAAPWPSFSEFEKCLYYWTEVNTYGIELADGGLRPDATVRFEDLFGGNAETMNGLYQAVGLAKPTIVDLSRVDSFRRRLALTPEVKSDRLWAQARSVSLRLGYTQDELRLDDGVASVSRYFRHYSRNARGATGLKKARRMVKAMLLQMIGH